MTSHLQADVQPLPGKQGLSTHNGGWEDKHHNPPFPELLSKKLCNISFVRCLLCEALGIGSEGQEA